MLLRGHGRRPPVGHVRTCYRSLRMRPMSRGAAIARAAAATEFLVRLCPRGSGPELRGKPGHNRARVDAACPAGSRQKPALQALAEQVSFPAERKSRLKPVLQTPAPGACLAWC